MLARTNWLGEFLKHGVLLAGAIVVLLPFLSHVVLLP